MLLFFYNSAMLLALVLLAPIWIPLAVFTEKRRQTFFQRLYMPAISHPHAAGEKKKPIWIHALSVGEVLSAEPLVKALAHRFGPQCLVFTASTRTGFETAVRVISPHVRAIRHFPYDTFFSVNRAVKVINPAQVVIVETDIWPNYLLLLSRRAIPVDLVNARLSDRSFKGYRRIAFVMKPLLCKFRRICVQTEWDRVRFQRLGVPGANLIPVGNIKFDQPPVATSQKERQKWRETLGLSVESPVWVAGSTHEGEETMLATALQNVRSKGIVDLRLIVAPRNPERAEAVRRLFGEAGFDAACLRQMEGMPTRARDIVVIDRMGLLRALYCLADIAFVGGSLVAAGGHNPLEPASVAKPVLFGPHTEDFRWICQMLEAAGGALRVETVDRLTEQIIALVMDPAQKKSMGWRAQRIFLQHRGAVARTMDRILLPSEGNRSCIG